MSSRLRIPSALRYELADGCLRRELVVGELVIRACISGFEPLDMPVPNESASLNSLWWKLRMQGHLPEALVPNRKRIRVVDLFCGAGGFAVGVAQLAREVGARVITALAVDTDIDATAVYARNHRTRITCSESVTTLVDFRTRGEGNNAHFVYPPEIIDPEISSLAADVDLVMAGPPCQGHSNLNNHSRRTDRRNHLYLHVPAMAIASNARAVLIENVTSVIHDAGQIVNGAKRLLADSGYHVVDGVLDAAAMGWPQTRRRHFLVAKRGDLCEPIALEEVQGLLALDQPLSVDWAIGADQRLSNEEMMHKVSDYTEENRARIQFLFDNNEHDLPNEQRPRCHQHGTSYGSVYGRLRADRPAPTITTGFLTPGRGRFIHPSEPRTLSPAEAARLQGFPDDYSFRPASNRPPTRSQLTKWIGDAVPMPLAYAGALSALATELV